MSGIDWAALYEVQRFPERTLYVAEQCKQPVAAVVPAASSALVATVPAVQRGPTERASTRERSVTRAPNPTAHLASATPPDPATTLLAALDTAVDDKARATLLAAASDETRSQLAHTLAYRRFIVDVARATVDDERKLAEFSRALDVAADDVARVAVIRAADPAMVAEWRWRAKATEESWLRRYMAAVGVTTT